MKFSVRHSILGLSAAAIFGGAAIGPAAAGYLSLFSSLTGQTSQPAPVANGDASVQLAAADRHFRDGSYTGQIFDAYYGQVQVQAHISGGHLVSIEALTYPAHSRTSRSINARALPMLESEVVSALNGQSARVDIISGATLTSRAYLRSLNSALGQAGS